MSHTVFKIVHWKQAFAAAVLVEGNDSHLFDAKSFSITVANLLSFRLLGTFETNKISRKCVEIAKCTLFCSCLNALRVIWYYYSLYSVVKWQYITNLCLAIWQTISCESQHKSHIDAHRTQVLKYYIESGWQALVLSRRRWSTITLLVMIPAKYLGDNDRAARVLFVQTPREQLGGMMQSTPERSEGLV